MPDSATPGPPTSSARRLRPYSHLFRQGIVACVVFMTPVLIVLYVLTIPHGTWLAVLVTQGVATVLVTIAVGRYLGTEIVVDENGLRERGFFGRVTWYPVGQIGSILLAHTFTGSATETLPQLFVRDASGKQIVRMRGQYWSRESMDVVISTLDVPFSTLPDAVSTNELREEHPGLLYWFERHPVVAALVFTASAGLVGATLFVVLRVIGMTP